MRHRVAAITRSHFGTLAVLAGCASPLAAGGKDPLPVQPFDDAGAPSASVETIHCTVTPTARLSTRIATVGIVTFTTDLLPVDSASIEFGIAGGTPMLAPVDLNAEGHRTLLLGMKQAQEYTYRVRLVSAGKLCTSGDYSIRTQQIDGAPRVTKSGRAGTPGFIVTSLGVNQSLNDPGTKSMYIFDTEGDVVWAAAGPERASRVHLDWEANSVWGMALNVAADTGRMDYVSMDGEQGEENVPALVGGHHDFAVVPGGKLVVLAWRTPFDNTQCTQVLEYDPLTRGVRTIVDSVASLYKPVADCHTNAIQYQEWDDTLTLSDRNPSLYVRLKRSGDLLWQLGGTDPVEVLLSGAGEWKANHGHHLTEDGRFILFNNGTFGDTHLLEFQIDEAAHQAVLVKDWSDGSTSSVLGDVERLPNGNTLATFSTSGLVREYDAQGQAIADYRGDFGYATFRTTLYGKPLRGAQH
jgi:Arylsulfotransferase (ASST)